MMKARTWLTAVIGLILMVVAPMGLNLAFADDPVPGPSPHGAPPSHDPSGDESSGPVAAPSAHAAPDLSSTKADTSSVSTSDVSTEAKPPFSVDWVGAAPETYSHASTGRDGGQYDNGTNQFTREELESEDFACGDHVRFYAAVSIEVEDPPSTLDVIAQFDKHNVGQGDVGYGLPITAGLNVPGDSGYNATGNETESTSVQDTGDEFTVTSHITGISGADSRIIVYFTATLVCTTQPATGNLHARLTDPGGNQEVTLKLHGELPPPPELVADVDIAKECPASATVGDTITYRITVTNTGTDDLEDIAVADSVLGDLSDSYADTLASGAFEVHTFPHTVAATPNPLVNTATVSATGVETQDTVTDSATCTTNVIVPPPALPVTGFKDGAMVALAQSFILFGVAMVLFWHGEPGRHRRHLFSRVRVRD